jgi:putative transposase
VVSSRSIRRYRRRRPSRPPSQSWRAFCANHAQAIWAAHLFVVQTLTFQTLYVIFFISHCSRQLLHYEVTTHPTAAWVWRQLIEATALDRKPQYLIRDRDRVWGADFSQRSSGLGIQSLRTAIQAPRANTIAERWVTTIRRECLDHLIPLSEQHLRRIVAEFVDYYNHDRPQARWDHHPAGPKGRLHGRWLRKRCLQAEAAVTTSMTEQLEPD